MPLLMIDPSLAQVAPTAFIDVPAGGAACLAFRVGQLLTIETVDPGPVACLFAFTEADPGEFLSPHHTRVFGGSFILRMGTRMVTNRRRPMFVIGRDSLRTHDLLLPASDTTRSAVEAALEAAERRILRIPDPVNLFANVRLTGDGRLEPRPSPARAGERITLRALIDGYAVVASAHTAIPDSVREVLGRVRAATYNEVLDLPGDLDVWTGR